MQDLSLLHCQTWTLTGNSNNYPSENKVKHGGISLPRGRRWHTVLQLCICPTLCQSFSLSALLISDCQTHTNITPHFKALCGQQPQDISSAVKCLYHQVCCISLFLEYTPSSIYFSLSVLSLAKVEKSWVLQTGLWVSGWQRGRGGVRWERWRRGAGQRRRERKNKVQTQTYKQPEKERGERERGSVATVMLWVDLKWFDRLWFSSAGLDRCLV